MFLPMFFLNDVAIEIVPWRSERRLHFSGGPARRYFYPPSFLSAVSVADWQV
jgi:hypothetical protein